MNAIRTVCFVLFSLCLSNVFTLHAEDNPPQPPQGGRGQFDPEQMRQRMLDRIKEALAPTDDEWKALQPKIEAIQKAQTQTRAGGGMFGRRRNNNNNNNAAATDAPKPEPSALEKKSQELKALLDAKDTEPKAVKDKLQEFRDTRDKAKADLKKAQTELLELLTPKQEAQLVMMGLLD